MVDAAWKVVDSLGGGAWLEDASGISILHSSSCLWKLRRSRDWLPCIPSSTPYLMRLDYIS